MFELNLSQVDLKVVHEYTRQRQPTLDYFPHPKHTLRKVFPNTVRKKKKVPVLKTLNGRLKKRAIDQKTASGMSENLLSTGYLLATYLL